MRRRRYGRYLMNQAAAADPAAVIPQAVAAPLAQAQGAIDAIKLKQAQFGKAVDRQMKSSMEFMKQAIGGMLGFVAVNAIESVVEKTFIADWGKIATKGIATGTVYFGARIISDDDTVRRAVLIGSLINVGLSILQDALAGKGVELGPGLSGRGRGNVIAYNPNYDPQSPAGYSGYDYGSGFDMPYSYELP